LPRTPLYSGAATRVSEQEGPGDSESILGVAGQTASNQWEPQESAGKPVPAVYLVLRENQRRNPESGQTRRNEPGTSLSTEALCGFAPGDIQRDLSEPGIRCELCAEFSVYPAYRVDLYPQLETGNKIKKA